MSSPERENHKWVVAMDDGIVSKGRSSRRIVTLPDPATQVPRQYILAKSSNKKKDDHLLVEMQSLPSEFSSFLIGRHIVRDGSLYLLNQVDPLFFVVATNATDESQKFSWQPLDQTLGKTSLPKEVVGTTTLASQMGHLTLTLCNDQTDNVTFFKFSIPKALGWLQQKQDRVYQALLQQDDEKQKRERATRKTCNKMQGGSVSSSFNMPDATDPTAATPSQQSQQPQDENNNSILSDTQQLKRDSIQIVCNYLSEAWTTKFLESLEMAHDAVFATALKSKTSTMAAAPSAVMDETPVKTAKVEAARTMGNKRLAKVSTKGTKSINSFFGAAPKKKAKKQ